jgi:hypothetical protein
MHVVPTKPLLEVGLAMMEGGRKYGAHNYRAVGVKMSVYYDAAMRHLMDWWEGEDIDPESGVSHVVKAIACLFVLRDSMHMDNARDDRPIQYPGGLDMRVMNEMAANIINMYPDCVRPYTQKDLSPRIPLLIAPKLDGARMALNMGQEMILAGEAVSHMEPDPDREKDEAYELELKNQAHERVAENFKRIQAAFPVFRDAGDKPVGLNPVLRDMSKYGKTHKPLSSVSRVTGQSMSKTVGGSFKLILPDDNKKNTVGDALKKSKSFTDLSDRCNNCPSGECNKCPDYAPKVDQSYFLPVCAICGSHDVKYFRQDTGKAYCSGCYYFNKIDLKPIIRS